MKHILKEIALAIGAFILLMVLIYFTFPWLFWGILNVLRVVFIIVLVIFLLALLLFITVMVMPLKYSIKINFVDDIKQVKGMTKFSWFLKIINGGIKYSENQLSWHLRVLNKRYSGSEILGGNNTKSSPDRKEADETIQSKTTEGKVSENKAIKSKTTETLSDKKVGDITTEESKAPNNHKAQNDSYSAEVRAKSSKDDSEENHKQDDGNLQDNTPINDANEDEPKIIRKIKDIIEKIQYTYCKICDKIKMVVEAKGKFDDGKDKITEFVNDEIHRKAFNKFIIELKKLLKRLKPKEIKGKCKFGFEDPKTTGTVLAGISLIYPYIGDNSTFEVDFENRVLAGQLDIVGRVRAVYFLLFFVRLIIRKYVRITIKNIIKFQKEFKTSEGGF